MVKLDYQKWRSELDAAMEKKDAAKITRLHIIRAQIRGKQHRQSARLPYYTISALGKLHPSVCEKIADNGGTAVIFLTHSDEEKLLKEEWKQYVVAKPAPLPTRIEPERGFIAAIKRFFGGVYRL